MSVFVCVSLHLVNSDKSLSPLVDESHPFVVPFRPYAWNSYPGSDLRQLVQQSFHHRDVDLDTSASFHEDGTNKSPLFPERTLGEESYGSEYRPSVGVFERTTPVFFPDGALHGTPHDPPTPPELLCSRLVLNGAYKCVKCGKVTLKWNHLGLKSFTICLLDSTVAN